MIRPENFRLETGISSETETSSWLRMGGGEYDQKTTEYSVYRKQCQSTGRTSARAGGAVVCARGAGEEAADKRDLRPAPAPRALRNMY